VTISIRNLAALCAFTVMVVMVLLLGMGGAYPAAPPKPPGTLPEAGKASPITQRKLVFMLTTGFEDLREVRLCLEDVKVAKKSGLLTEVILIFRGRGVDALASVPGLVRPPEIVQLAREVTASGVRTIVSGNALQQYGMPAASLDPKPTELVPDPALRMTELVAHGYPVIRY
jgi:hypothetical protein